MKRVVQGDSRANRLLAHRLAGRVALLVRRLLGDSETSDATALRALIEILRSAVTYRETESIESWADAIAIRMTLQKPHKRVVPWLQRQPASTSLRGLPVAQFTSEPPHRLAEYLEALPRPEREVLVLQAMSNCTLQHIGELTATTLPAVRQRLIAARTQLRHMISTRTREVAPNRNYQRWTDCMDRLALGETLTCDELAFCESASSSNPRIRTEVELLHELAQQDTEPNAQHRNMVDAALKGIAVSAERADREEVTRLKHAGHAHRFWWICAAVVSTTIGVLVLFFPAHPSEQRPSAAAIEPAPGTQLIYAAGEVRVDSQPIRATSLVLSEGATLEVARGMACISMEPGIVICAGEGSRLRMSAVHGRWRRLDLGRGRVAVQLPLQPHDWRLSIVTGSVWSTSTGASFALESDSESTRATVLDGEIGIGTEAGPASKVGARHSVRIESEGGTHLAASGDLEEAQARALLKPAAMWHKPLGATLDLRGLPANAEILVDEQVIGTAPLLTRLPAGPHALQVGVGNNMIAALQFSAEIGRLTVLSVDQPGQALATERLPSRAPSR